MTPRRLNAAVCAFVALAAGVAGNVILLQRGSANRAVRGTFEPVASGAHTKPGRETSANGPDGTLASGQSSPVLGFGGHHSPPNGGIPDASPSPRSGSTVGDTGRSTEVTGAFTATNSGDVIQAVQRELGRRGYNPGIPNGVANVATREAIMAYQRDHGLPLTGEASEALLKAIVFESSGVVRAPASTIGAEHGKVPTIRTAQ